MYVVKIKKVSVVIRELPFLFYIMYGN